ncbi:unnamed protein product [Calicophoron daubneyi]|uniref:Threonylcarbamoyl-AMP synthase n=1 Tax=Calicophoron daubneyi TaxID=300641 RepID=A0AAV2T0B8_CALDB
MLVPELCSQLFCRLSSLASIKMVGKIMKIEEASAQLSWISKLIADGGVIALPTDTLYGVACSVHCTSALERIWELKGRSFEKPMAICLDKVSSIPCWCDTQALPPGLLDDLLPGPVTVLLPRLKKDPLNPRLNPGAQLVGVRVPDSGFIMDLVSALSKITSDSPSDTVNYSSQSHPLVLTSANLSGAKSALTVEEFSAIWPSLDLIVDGGRIHTSEGSDPNSARAGSTIVDLSRAGQKMYSIMRDGNALERTVEILEQRYGLHLLTSVTLNGKMC